MQVTVQLEELTAMKEQSAWLMNLVRAMVVKHADSKGTYRLSTADMNKANGQAVDIKPLKKSTKFTVTKEEG